VAVAAAAAAVVMTAATGVPSYVYVSGTYARNITAFSGVECDHDFTAQNEDIIPSSRATVALLARDAIYLPLSIVLVPMNRRKSRCCATPLHA